MDVTRHNLAEVLPQVKSSIKDCDFVAIDTELSGLRRDRLLNLFDTLEERYLKLKDSTSGYLLIQFGLSCFKRKNKDSDDTPEYDCKTYNFYIFPYKPSNNIRTKDRTFLVQSSAMTFLVGHGFDFNKLIRDGITWLNVDEEEVFMKGLEQNGNTPINEKSDPPSGDIVLDSNDKFPLIPDEEKDFINDVVANINKFIRDENTDQLEIPACSPYKRKLIYQLVQASQYNHTIDINTITTTSAREKAMVLKKVDLAEKQLERKKLINETVGFSKVIKVLIQCGKPIVGHNLLLDLMHTVNQFVSPLPDNFADFQTMVKELFPQIYDTKYIAASKFKLTIQDTSLEELHKTLQKDPFSSIVVNVDSSDDKSAALHQAGYDAYITGYCYAVLTNQLKDSLEDVKNRLHVTYIFDIDCWATDSDNLTPERDHVYYVTFPGEWSNNNLYELFSPYGNITISWIDDTSAFVALRNKEKAQEATTSLQASSCKLGAVFKVVTYSQYVQTEKDRSLIHSNKKRKSGCTLSTPVADKDNQANKKQKT